MRQQHRIDRIAHDRQVREARHQVAAARHVRVGHHALTADTRMRQQLAPDAPGAQLHQFQAEHVVEGIGQQPGLGLDQGRSQAPGLPLMQRGEQVDHRSYVSNVTKLFRNAGVNGSLRVKFPAVRTALSSLADIVTVTRSKKAAMGCSF
jgi:hypothetical protein